MTDDEFNEMADRRHFVLGPEAFDAWEAMLDAPSKDCPKLRELMQSESPTIIVHELASDEWIEAHHIYIRDGRIVIEIRP